MSNQKAGRGKADKTMIETATFINNEL